MKLSTSAQAGIGLALVVLAGPAGFFLYRSALGNYRPGATVAAVSAPAPASAATAPAAGSAPASSEPTLTPPEQLPDLALPDAAGVSHKLSDYRGKPLLLNFWASWCEPCRREMPLLESLHRQHADAVQVVGVAVDFRADALKFAKAQGVDYPMLQGEHGGLEAAQAVGIPELALPFTVIADGQGHIVKVKLGELHPDEADLILSNLAELNAGHLSLAAARSGLSDGLRDLAVIRAKGSVKTRQ